MKRYFGFFFLSVGFSMMCACLARGDAMLALKEAAQLCLRCIGVG